MGSRRPHCLTCGYDRSGIPAEALCPECGAEQRETPPDHEPSAGAARASISLGLGVLSWIGLVGFGVIAIPLGIGAIALSISAMRTLSSEFHADRRPMLTAIGGLALGATGTLMGVTVSIVIAMSIR